MRKAGAVHAHENVRVVRVAQLLDEGRLHVVGDHCELDASAHAATQLGNELVLVEHVAVLGLASEQRDADLVAGERTALLDAEAVEHVLIERPCSTKTEGIYY